jgi:hypothetical protein
MVLLTVSQGQNDGILDEMLSTLVSMRVSRYGISELGF